MSAGHGWLGRVGRYEGGAWRGRVAGEGLSMRSILLPACACPTSGDFGSPYRIHMPIHGFADVCLPTSEGRKSISRLSWHTSASNFSISPSPDCPAHVDETRGPCAGREDLPVPDNRRRLPSNEIAAVNDSLEYIGLTSPLIVCGTGGPARSCILQGGVGGVLEFIGGRVGG